LAFCRVLLAAGCLIALWLEPAVIKLDYTIVVILAACYLAASLSFLIWALISASPIADSLVSMHVVDVVWPPLICLFTGSFNTPAVVILLFAVLAAAYRWGFAETFASATASILLTALGRAVAASQGESVVHIFPAPRSAAPTFVAGAICLLLLGVVLGYLADREKSFRARILAVRQLVTGATPEAGLRETLDRCLRTIANLSTANQVVLAVRDDRRNRVFVWTLEGGGVARPKVQFAQVSAAEHERYFFDAPGHAWHFSRKTPGGGRGNLFPCLVLNAQGGRLPNKHFSFANAFFLKGPARSLFAINFEIPAEWSGRLFVLDAVSHSHISAELSFLQSLVLESLPTVYNVYLLQRLRSRVRTQERLRIAHEVHDGLLQSLISVEMQMDLLRRRSGLGSQTVAEELRGLQQVLHHEILGARSLLARLKLTEMSPRQMLDVMSEMVEDFRRETGIASSFACSSEPTGLPAHVCREIACMLKEALTNVRKHSGAKSVRVLFAMEGDSWKLVIADDGKGFEFSGRLSASQSRGPRSTPVVLTERAHSIGADVEIESAPGHGSRVEIQLRQQESYG